MKNNFMNAFCVTLLLFEVGCNDNTLGQEELKKVDGGGSNVIIQKETKNSQPSVSSEENNNSDIKVISEEESPQLQSPKNESPKKLKIGHNRDSEKKQQPKQSEVIPKEVSSSHNGEDLQGSSATDSEDKSDNNTLNTIDVVGEADKPDDAHNKKHPEDIVERSQGRIETYRDEIGKKSTINPSRREKINERKKRMKQNATQAQEEQTDE